MSKLLIMVALLSGACPGFAQGRDTVFAVHKLFAQKRGDGERTAATGASLVTGAETLRGAITGSMVGAAPTVLGLRQAQQYSTLREQEILSQYAAGTPVPADVRRKLRRKYFHRTTKDVANAQP